MAAITVGFLGSMTSHGAYVSIQCLETRNCAIYLVSTCGNYLSTKVGGGILYLFWHGQPFRRGRRPGG
jgi:hypothetical protein